MHVHQRRRETDEVLTAKFQQFVMRDAVGLPHTDEDLSALADELGISIDLGQSLDDILAKFKWGLRKDHLKGLDDRPRLPRNQRIPHLKRGGFKGR